MQSGSNQESSLEDISTKMGRDFFTSMKLDEEEKEREIYEVTEEFREEDEADEDDDGDEENDEEEFSFSVAFDGVNTSHITAEEAFFNGQIKPLFPLFNQDLLLQEGVDMENLIPNERLPNVKKVFVEVGNEADVLPPTPSTSDVGDVAGPYCDWEKKAVQVVPEGCKKSNSTGFSKIWRFKDFMHRSSSDGRDAFVFLNNSAVASSSSGITVSGKKEEKKASRKAAKKKEVPESKVNDGEGKVKAAGEKGKGKAKKAIKSKTAVSAHEVYMRSKAREEERRKSYLPYRPEVVGFFTNISGGGLSRNLHPF